MSLDRRIEQAITAASGQAAQFRQSRSISGGSINHCRLVTLRDGRRLFLKTHPASANYPGMFATEYQGLSLLAAPGVIHVPRALACDEDFIVMEAFTASAPAPDWQELMGRRLALLHQATRREAFGFDADNFLGATPQPNAWRDRWLDFWREQRLGWQLQLFSRNTGADDGLLVLGDRLLARLDELLGDVDEPAVLLHGDLWSGNAAADEQGEPIIYDPACYYGQREAEIGMMRLFGGFGPRCEAAYGEVWPLLPGADRRITLYRLYHELNHLNLFGRGYYNTCIATMNQLL
jgi:fructosamine-3-kinase